MMNTENKSRPMLEPLETRRLLSAVPTDPDDQIAEAPKLKVGTVISGNWSCYNDVDMYKLTVGAKSRIAFQVNDPLHPGWLSTHATIAVLDAAGNVLDMRLVADPSYLDFRFDQGGTYYFAVSYDNNSANFFNPLTGDGDVGTGQYYEANSYPIRYQLKTTELPYAPKLTADLVEHQTLAASFQSFNFLPGFPEALSSVQLVFDSTTFYSLPGQIAWKDATLVASISAYDTASSSPLTQSLGTGGIGPDDFKFDDRLGSASLDADLLLVDALTASTQLAHFKLSWKPAGAIQSLSDRADGFFLTGRFAPATAKGTVQFKVDDSSRQGLLIGVNMTPQPSMDAQMQRTTSLTLISAPQSSLATLFSGRKIDALSAAALLDAMNLIN